MNPQSNPAQLQHAIENGTKLTDAKKLEIEAYSAFRADGRAIIEFLFDAIEPDRSKMNPAHPALETFDRLRRVMDLAVVNLLQSHIARAQVELEELEMQVKAYKFLHEQAGSRIQLPNFKG